MPRMIGGSEQSLIAGMGRAPDATVEPAPDIKLLQWCWQRSYAMSDRMLGYSYGGGTIRPIPNTRTAIVLDGCVTEWTVEHGVATRYRQEGNVCSAPAMAAAGPLTKD